MIMGFQQRQTFPKKKHFSEASAKNGQFRAKKIPPEQITADFPTKFGKLRFFSTKVMRKKCGIVEGTKNVPAINFPFLLEVHATHKCH